MPDLAPHAYLMHGMWCTGQHLEPLAAALRQMDLITHAPTLPLHRHGLDRDLRNNLGRHSLRDYLRFHLNQIRQLKLESPPVLVGHSMGGLLAQMAATEIEVAGLVLLAPASPAGINIIRPSSTLATSHILARPAFWRRANRPPRWHARYGLFHGMDAFTREQQQQQLVHESGRAYFEIVFWWLDRNRASAVDAAKVAAPVLVIAGDRDRIITPAVARKVYRLYRDARLVMLPELGHMMLYEDGAEQIYPPIEHWWRSIQRRAPATPEAGGADIRAD